MSERDDARELLRELLHEALAGPNGNGDGAVAAGPRAAGGRGPAARRPGAQPAAGGEVIGGGARGRRASSRSRSPPTTTSTASCARCSPASRIRRREAIRAGRLRFTLGARRAGGGRRARVERGAVTERTVEEAAKAGARLVLGPGAVLTPLAREKARAKGIEIEREG